MQHSIRLTTCEHSQSRLVLTGMEMRGNREESRTIGVFLSHLVAWYSFPAAQDGPAPLVDGKPLGAGLMLVLRDGHTVAVRRRDGFGGEYNRLLGALTGTPRDA